MAAITTEVKHRRSSIEVAAAADLAAKSRKRVPDPAKFRAAAKYTEATEKSPSFEDGYHKSAIDGLPIQHFYVPGDYMLGILGDWEGETHGPSSARFLVEQMQIRGIVSQFDPPRVMRVPGNRRLAVAVRRADCLYQRIKITYRGKKRQKNQLFYEKVYLVQSAPLSKEPIAESMQKV